MRTIAVVGSGSWGLNIIKNFAALDKLGMVCDINKTNFEKIKNDYPNIKLTANIKDVVRNKEIEAVVIATPPVTHFEAAKKMIISGKHIWVEKPVALKSKDASILAQMAEKKYKKVLVGHILMYHPAYCKLKELIAGGYFGKINYTVSKRCAFGKVRKSENVLWSLAVHDIAAVIYLLGTLPKSVSCTGANYVQKNVADVIYANLEFKGGVTAHINASWLNPYKERKFILVGEEKSAVIDELDKGAPLKVYNQKVIKAPVNTLKEEFFPMNREEEEAFNFDNIEMLAEECRHFIDCIENNKTPRTDAKSAVSVVKVLEDCERSMKKGGKKIK